MEKSDIAKREEEILAFWKRQSIFEKSLEKKSPKGEFVFYDGPPFATGLPHTGSLLASVIKDVVPRYKTMQGYRVERRWGWDCHGLPIENMIEKKLGLKSKKDILEIGIEVFNEAARASVLEFANDWEKYVDRIGRWVDFKNSYKTMDTSYIESVWWGLKELNAKKLLYEGRKVLMYCPHCETPLAKAEIAQDNTYKDITEETVTVKFKIKNPRKHNLPENTYLLAWTTTPWTLPGNVALAVGKEIEYVLVEERGEFFILAENLLQKVLLQRSSDLLEDSARPFVKELSAANVIGLEYEPLFDVPAVHSNKAYKVYAADFVTTDEGTGIVHTAVMYGEDDFTLGQKENLPMVQLLEANGVYNSNAPEFLRGQYIKKAEKDIKEDLEKRGLLFSRAPHTHSYPHCYRCGTPLIYNAVVSWFINIQKIKKQLLAENEKIAWTPGHLKHGRFKHNVEQAPDWTISRNRFWASPLPIWKEKGGSKLMVIGSLAELLAKTKKSGNAYFVMRHGEARNNVEGVVDSGDAAAYHLTEKGKADALASVCRLSKEHIDLIITSPVPRAKETAALVQHALGLPDSAVMVDERIREIGFGVYSGKKYTEWKSFFSSFAERFTKAPDGGENYLAVRKRLGDFLFEVERRYAKKNILIVMHEGPSFLLAALASHLSLQETIAKKSDEHFLAKGDFVELPFTPYPHTAEYELDLHRPYIDAVTLIDAQGHKYERIPEVIDCWVESGAMPFASNHYPFSNKKTFNPKRGFGLFPKGYPADFIAEYIAQTRTWFYYMHAVGVALFGRSSFRSVVSTGTILAADGSKMSKSKGNYTDPLLVMDRFGADALRFHLMGSVVMQAEDLNFRDDDVREAHNRVLGMLLNCFRFFELYKAEYDAAVQSAESPHALDRWIRALLAELIAEVTKSLDAYDLPRACRLLREFIDDYSTWYLRRSRSRVKQGGADKQYALATQHDVLVALAKLLAPITPFMAEYIYKEVGGEKESVHLAQWPRADAFKTDAPLIADMRDVRQLVSTALQMREKAGMKIRQPLAQLKAKKLPADAGLRALIADEVNVKEVVEDTAMEGEVWLDTELTPELHDEGVFRDLVRAIQDWRKQEKMQITDRPEHILKVTTAEEVRVAEKFKAELAAQTGLAKLEVELVEHA